MHRNLRLASALLRDLWLIDATQAESLLPMVQSLIDKAQLHHDDGAAEAKQLDPLFGCFAVQLGTDAGTQHYKTFDEAPSGSTAVLYITGPILKDDYCDVGMNGKAEQIRAAYQHPNINSLLIKFDTPGGQSNAPALAADAIREARAAGVPVLGWVDHGMVASAGAWIFAACTEGWMSQPSDQVGSIGAYQRVRKNASTDVLEVYAPQSTQKNLPQRKAASGDTSLLEAELGELVDVFHASVQADRGDRLKTDGTWHQGGLFMGEKAVAEGLADGICTFAQAVQRVQELAATAATELATGPLVLPPNLSTDSLNPTLLMKYPLLCALLGINTDLVVDKEKGSYLQEAQLQGLETGLAAYAAKDTELTTTKGALTTATTNLTAATTRAEEAEKELATYANVPGKDNKNPIQHGQDRQPEASADEEVDPYLAQVMTYKASAGLSNGPAAK
jgi:ClpP class serine protease